MGGKEEKRHDKCRKALPGSVVPLLFFLGMEGTGCFHQVNTGGKKTPTPVVLGQGLRSRKVCSRRILLFSLCSR